MKKKIILLLPAFFLALSLGACNSKKSAENNSNGNQQQNQGGDSGQQSGDNGQSGQQGGEQGGEQGAVTYTCTSLPDWITNDGCVIFAWAWSANDTGSWKACSYGEAPVTSLTFEVSEELTGFLLARCAANTTEPNWKATENGPGKVYNKTNDVTCSAGVHEYVCSDWVSA